MEENGLEYIEAYPQKAYIVDEQIARAYKYVVDEDFETPSQVRELVKLLDSVTENDTVYLTINNYGGCKITMLSVIDAIANCQGYVIAQVILASSAGSLIALACDDVILTKFSEFYIHQMQSINSGDTSLQRERIDFLSKTQHHLFEEIYSGFLTEAELDGLKKGTIREFNFDYRDAEPRLEAWRKYKQEKFEIENGAITKAKVEETTETTIEATKKKSSKALG